VRGSFFFTELLNRPPDGLDDDVAEDDPVRALDGVVEELELKV
jgi:hypothetical protein